MISNIAIYGNYLTNSDLTKYKEFLNNALDWILNEYSNEIDEILEYKYKKFENVDKNNFSLFYKQDRQSVIEVYCYHDYDYLLAFIIAVLYHEISVEKVERICNKTFENVAKDIQKIVEKHSLNNNYKSFANDIRNYILKFTNSDLKWVEMKYMALAKIFDYKGLKECQKYTSTNVYEHISSETVEMIRNECLKYNI